MRYPDGGVRRLVACLSVAVVVPGGSILAQSRVEGVSAPELFVMAERARADSDIEKAIVMYEALAKDPDAEVRAEARFRKGMMLAGLRRYREAAVAFRAVLDEKPDAARVRLELANVLARLGDEPGARRELRQAEAVGLPPDVATTVQQFALALRGSRRFGGSIEVALAPDSNVNRATNQRVLDTVIAPVTLSRDARARSGLGIKLSASGFARIELMPNLDLVPRVAGIANLYRAGQFDDISAQALLGLEWRRGTDRWSPSVGAAQRWYGGRPYAFTRTFGLTWLHPAGPRSQWVLGTTASKVDYRINDLQDGALFSASATYDRALSARTGISTAVVATRQTARDPGYATWSWGVSELAWREVGKSTFVATLGLNRLDGDRALFIFPERRKEWLVDVGAGVTLRQLAFRGFAPVVRIGYQRNFSTVALYDYSRVSSDIGITRAF
jgi:hypothetical protein